MDFMQSVKKRVPFTPAIPKYEDISKTAEKLSPKLSFFNRRIRLKGNSRISIPLGIVLLFPLIVVILILILIVRHPDSPGRMLMPAGAPPTIRYVLADHSVLSAWEPD